MTKENFLRYYNKLTGADKTLVFFQFNNMVYLYECKHIAPRWLKKVLKVLQGVVGKNIECI